jgi:hypothetical protein
MCRDHILKIHVFWDVTLDQWRNSSAFLKAWQCLHLKGKLLKDGLTLEMEAPFKMPKTIYPTIQCNIPRRLESLAPSQ